MLIDCSQLGLVDLLRVPEYLAEAQAHLFLFVQSCD